MLEYDFFFGAGKAVRIAHDNPKATGGLPVNTWVLAFAYGHFAAKHGYVFSSKTLKDDIAYMVGWAYGRKFALDAARMSRTIG